MELTVFRECHWSIMGDQCVDLVSVQHRRQLRVIGGSKRDVDVAIETCEPVWAVHGEVGQVVWTVWVVHLVAVEVDVEPPDLAVLEIGDVEDRSEVLKVRRVIPRDRHLGPVGGRLDRRVENGRGHWKLGIQLNSILGGND